MFGYFYSTSKIYTTYHDLCPFDCLLDLLGWLSSESLRLHVQGTDDALLKVDTQFDHTIWSLHLVAVVCWYYLWIIPWSIVIFFLWPLFQCTFFHGAVVCFLLPNIIGLLALYIAFIQLPSFSVIFFIYFYLFSRWILTIFADLFGCVKLCPIQLKFSLVILELKTNSVSVYLPYIVITIL